MFAITRSAHQVFKRLVVHQHDIQTLVSSRSLHCSSIKHGRDVEAYKTEKKLAKKSGDLFDEIARRREANKKSFKFAIDLYISKEEIYRRGHVDFIYSALDRMKEFKAVNDLEIYKKLLEVFPPQKMIPKGPWQVEFMHFPRQQQCAIDLMEQMEDNGVIPDHEFGSILKKIFGPDAHAFRKYRRMMYWLPKFKNANPYPVPRELPEDPSLLAVVALKRMAVDKENVITVWKTSEVETEPIEDTYIASAQSPIQQDLIKQHPVDTPLFVEGGYTVWLRDKSLMYFTLRADPKPQRVVKKEKVNDDEELSNWKVYDSEDPVDLIPAWSIHEQEDGTVLGMCVTGTSSKDSLVTWIRYLQRANPRLVDIPVVFTLRTPDAEVQVVEDKEKNKEVAQTR